MHGSLGRGGGTMFGIVSDSAPRFLRGGEESDSAPRSQCWDRSQRWDRSQAWDRFQSWDRSQRWDRSQYWNRVIRLDAGNCFGIGYSLSSQAVSLHGSRFCTTWPVGFMCWLVFRGSGLGAAWPVGVGVYVFAVFRGSGSGMTSSRAGVGVHAL